MDFFEHEKVEVSSEAMAKIRDLVEAGHAKKKIIDEKSDELERLGDELRAIEGQLLPLLEGVKMEEASFEVGRVRVDQKISVKMPSDPEAREKFFQFLKDRQVYEGMRTVLSASLNSFYNAELESCAVDGREFKIPGIEASAKYSKLKWLKGKKK